MMASDHEASCESDPNFAVICGFLEKFGEICGLSNVDFLHLQYMLENSNEVSPQLIDLHIKLLRKARKTVSTERWERALVKVCHSYGSKDAWEIERFGYRKSRLPAKLRILKQLLEMQFDFNIKFKSEINKLSADELRTQPLGRDRSGHAYWFQADDNCQIRVYKEDPDEETWLLVAKDRDGVDELITHLSDNKDEVVNEDSNSLESEKPTNDTGQPSDNPESNGQSNETQAELETTESKNEEPTPPSPPTTTTQNNPANAAPVPVGLNLTTSDSKIVGVKEKYMRGDLSSGGSTRKAVDSAGYSAHAKYLKSGGGNSEDEHLKEPVYAKRARLDRPTLLGSRKKKKASSESSNDEGKEETSGVSEEIEEPLMLVKGDGSGQDNNSPIISTTIEEPIKRFYGEGSGFDCQTGNESLENQQNGSKPPDNLKLHETKEESHTDTKTNNNCDSSPDEPENKNFSKYLDVTNNKIKPKKTLNYKKKSKAMEGEGDGQILSDNLPSEDLKLVEEIEPVCNNVENGQETCEKSVETEEKDQQAITSKFEEIIERQEEHEKNEPVKGDGKTIEQEEVTELDKPDEKTVEQEDKIGLVKGGEETTEHEDKIELVDQEEKIDVKPEQVEETIGLVKGDEKTVKGEENDEQHVKTDGETIEPVENIEHQVKISAKRKSIEPEQLELKTVEQSENVEQVEPTAQSNTIEVTETIKPVENTELQVKTDAKISEPIATASKTNEPPIQNVPSDADDDMEIDETVNNKTIDLTALESQIIKPSDPVLPDTLQIECVTVDTPTATEPKCVKKRMSLLTCVDIDKLKGENRPKSQTPDDLIDSNLEQIARETEQDPIRISDSEKSSDVVIFGDSEPLTLSEGSDKPTKKNFAPDLDVEDSIPAVRLTRKRLAEFNAGSGKRLKLKGKKAPERQTLRRITEEVSSSSSGEENEQKEVKKKSPRIVKKKRPSKHSDLEQSSDVVSDSSSNKRPKPAPRKKTLMGLDISPETESILRGDGDGISGIRQSRRIAQLKIKEEAERRKLEELALQEHKEEQRKRKSKKNHDQDYKAEKRKHTKVVISSDDETPSENVDSEEKRKRKKKRKQMMFDVSQPWKSSSGSSSSEVEEEEEEVEAEEDDHVLKSDHEFSPESDLGSDNEWMPLKRARTVRKEVDQSDSDEPKDDCPCQKCGKSDHPEWILLCDSCDVGWHCSCLRPPLLVIPEGDWFCPPCQHMSLIKNLQLKLADYDKKLTKKEMEVRRKERLAYVGISLDNVLPAKEHESHKKTKSDNDSGSESDSSDTSESESSSSASDSEPIYQLRERRQAHSYRFNDYDELINSAIQDELDAVKGAGNQGRGKDIANIVDAEKAEEQQEEEPPKAEEAEQPEVLPPVEEKPATPLHESENESVVKKSIIRKKHRKLNSLDVSSEDDAESDEDFKGSSTTESEEEFDEDDVLGSDSSDEGEFRGGKRKRGSGPIRRSTRARISLYDREFINDNSDSGGGYSKRKKTRPEWDETESEESDRSWGRKKRQRNARSRRTNSDTSRKKKLKKKKKRKRNEDSDPEVYRHKPNIKFGGLDKFDELESRRTRGKKINYLEALGTDSDEELPKKPSKVEESEDEEYIVQEDEIFKNHLNSEKNSEESDIENLLEGIPTVSTIKPRGKGKSGLKIARSLQEQIPLFPPVADLAESSELPVTNVVVALSQPVAIEQPLPLTEQEILTDEETNPIELINKNVEAMDEQEMKKMMEEEDYANKQLQLLALQIEKERKRKEREALRLEKATPIGIIAPAKTESPPPAPPLLPSTIPPHVENNNVPPAKKRGRKPKNLLDSEGGMPPKRRGRGKGKKTLAAEAAAIASANGTPPEPEPLPPIAGNKLAVAAPPQPFSQSQPAPSVITRMLQAAQQGQGYFELPSYPRGPRGAPLPPPFQQPPRYPAPRGGPPPPRRHPLALPPMYHPHRALDPSPSGGGPINLQANPVPAGEKVDAASGPPQPPPPAYTAAAPPLGHFPPPPPPPPGNVAAQHLLPPPPVPGYLPGTQPPNFYGPFSSPSSSVSHPDGVPPPPRAFSSTSYDEQFGCEGGAAAPPATAASGGKQFEEETGEFGGLVSYFSSQREDDLDE